MDDLLYGRVLDGRNLGGVVVVVEVEVHGRGGVRHHQRVELRPALYQAGLVLTLMIDTRETERERVCECVSE